VERHVGPSWVYTITKAYAIFHQWEVHLESYMAKVDNTFPTFRNLFLNYYLELGLTIFEETIMG